MGAEKLSCKYAVANLKPAKETKEESNRVNVGGSARMDSYLIQEDWQYKYFEHDEKLFLLRRGNSKAWNIANMLLPAFNRY